MKVILLERIGRTGTIGDEVTVKDGFARNFLLPQGKALRATEANRKKFEGERAAIEKRNDDRRNAAAGIADGLNGKTVVIIRQAGETGQLYGSVASRDIVEALAAEGFTVQRSQIDLTDPIKSVGVHTVPLNLHAEVAVTINVNVARSEDEAARQDAGEDVTVTVYEDDVEGDFAAGQKDAQQDDRFDDEL
ncbi:50S ribosomal protein L9 [Devosia epidermidihirudinis]|uniref:Large ribosomal subunit protein bL9 n=1 Tax=Devosia epidermidihirudinis TaxID=1293439 RepID=A0A0F5QFE5_9HYPH|nr:50S ribosomal protein L9 [Devosia epidermidihirudinis]KKC39697.1 50S ribosomal protein L9 [Devosia epidermidihirudinis]